MATTADTKSEQPLALYLLNLEAGNLGTPGAPILHLGLLVDAARETVTGHGKVTQAIAPPDSAVELTDLQGTIEALSTEPSVRVLTLSGKYLHVLTPPAIGTVVFPFTATIVLPEAQRPGRGSFSYGQHTVKDVPVKDVPTEAASS